MRRREEQPPAAEPWGPAEAFTYAAGRFMAELRVELLNTINAVPERGDHVKSIPPGTPSRVIATSANTIKGWSLHETTGAAAALVYLREGRDNTGDILAVIALAAGAHETLALTDRGISTALGVYLDVANGAVEGAVYFSSS